MIERQDDVIGHKMMIYTIDKSDKTREPIRKLTIDFFEQELGFKDHNIIFVDRMEFGEDQTNFSDETKEEMCLFARIFFRRQTVQPSQSNFEHRSLRNLRQ